MPLLAFVHSEERPPGPGGPPPWQPDWRLWRWVLAGALLWYGAARVDAPAVRLVLAIAVFAVACRALAELMPSGDGMRQYRQ